MTKGAAEKKVPAEKKKEEPKEKEQVDGAAPAEEKKKKRKAAKKMHVIEGVPGTETHIKKLVVNKGEHYQIKAGKNKVEIDEVVVNNGGKLTNDMSGKNSVACVIHNLHSAPGAVVVNKF